MTLRSPAARIDRDADRVDARSFETADDANRTRVRDKRPTAGDSPLPTDSAQAPAGTVLAPPAAKLRTVTLCCSRTEALTVIPPDLPMTM